MRLSRTIPPEQIGRRKLADTGAGALEWAPAKAEINPPRVDNTNAYTATRCVIAEVDRCANSRSQHAADEVALTSCVKRNPAECSHYAGRHGLQPETFRPRLHSHGGINPGEGLEKCGPIRRLWFAERRDDREWD